MRREQADLEQKLWSERQAINMKFEDKVKVSQTKYRALFFSAS
jgi:hypothetical protein